MNIDLVAWVATLVLGVVFAVAGVAKLRDQDGTRAAVAEFGLPTWALGAGALILPASELAIAGLLIVPATSLIGSITASVLLAGFIAGISWNIARGRHPECRCFGQLHSAPVGAKTIFRNLVLLGLASLPMINGGVSVSAALNESFTDADRLTLYVSFAGIVATSVLALIVYQLSNRVRELRNQLLRAALQPAALLPFGSPAPAFDLETAAGGSITLRDLTVRDVPTLLIFVSASCGPCQELMPEIARWQAAYDHVVSIAMIASGPREGSISKARAHELTDVLLDEDGSISDAYGADATPSAILLNEDGDVDTEMVAGPDRIHQIIEAMIAAHAKSLWREATGEHLVVSAISDAGTRASASGTGA